MAIATARLRPNVLGGLDATQESISSYRPGGLLSKPVPTNEAPRTLLTAESTQASQTDYTVDPDDVAAASSTAGKRSVRSQMPGSRNDLVTAHDLQTAPVANMTSQPQPEEQDSMQKSRGQPEVKESRDESLGEIVEEAGANSNDAECRDQGSEAARKSLTRTVASAPLEVDVASPEGQSPVISQSRRKRTPRNRNHGVVAGDFAQAGGTTLSRGRRGGRKRASTPQGAEDVQIDVSTVSMASLTKDPRTGKMSKREEELRTIDWDEVYRKRREAEERRLAALESPAKEDPNSTNARLTRAEETVISAMVSGPQVRVVDGQMVVDHATLEVDRHAEARIREADLEEAVEDDLTAPVVNSLSFINDNKRDPNDRRRTTIKGDPWTEDSTDAFYEALRMFGTDFTIISNMFPGRSRRHIKLKFVREERADPARIKEALISGQVEMDMSRYVCASGKKEEHFLDPEALQRELDEERNRHEEGLRVHREKKRDEERQRVAAGYGEDGDGNDKEDEAGKGKKKDKKKRKNWEAKGGGEEEILGLAE